MFWGDFFANTLHLSAQEMGAYALLIAHAWEHDGQIPLGKDAQRIVRIPDNRIWRRVWGKLEPFFTPVLRHQASGTRPVVAICPRVVKELAVAAEISNKRKAAAEQMHANKRANADKGLCKSTSSILPKEDRSLLGKEGKEAALPKKVAATPGWRPRIDGDEERSPPRTKSDNPLEPIPERRPARRK